MVWADGDALTPDNLNFKSGLGPVYHAKAYGATGLGVADDTTSAQSAANAATAAGGGVVYFSHGTYLLSQLTLGYNVHLCGDGIRANGSVIGTKLKLKDSANTSLIIAYAAQANTISNLELDGNKTNQTGTSHGIDFPTHHPTLWYHNSRVEDCFIHDFLTDGVNVGRAVLSVMIDRCDIRNSGRDNVQLRGSDNKVLASIIGSADSCGVALLSAACMVQNCDIYQNQIGVQIAPNAYDGISGNFSANNVVMGCKINENDRQAVIVNGRHNLVVGNQIDANGLEAASTYPSVDVYNWQGITVSGNVFSNTNSDTTLPNYHINLQSGASHVQAVGNTYQAGSSAVSYTNAPLLYTVPDTRFLVEFSQNVADGAAFMQTSTGSDSPRIFLGNSADGTGVSLRASGNTLNIATGAVPGSTSGTLRLAIGPSQVQLQSGTDLQVGSGSSLILNGGRVLSIRTGASSSITVSESVRANEFWITVGASGLSLGIESAGSLYWINSTTSST